MSKIISPLTAVHDDRLSMVQYCQTIHPSGFCTLSWFMHTTVLNLLAQCWNTMGDQLSINLQDNMITSLRTLTMQERQGIW